jgi:hypothetical protein
LSANHVDRAVKVRAAWIREITEPWLLADEASRATCTQMILVTRGELYKPPVEKVVGASSSLG